MNRQTQLEFTENSGDISLQARLLYGLRSLLKRKPHESASRSTQDEFNLKLQEIYFELISSFPQFSITQKLELEMWNTLYKSRIDALQNALHNRSAGSTTALLDGQQRSVMELKLHFILLLDRASGVYLSLITRLVHSLSDSTWPKSILSSITSQAAPLGLFKFRQLGLTSGRFDLDLATFHALPGSFVHNAGCAQSLDTALEAEMTADSMAAPRILSRGDRLPPDVLDSSGGDSKTAVASPVTNGKIDYFTAIHDSSVPALDDEVAMSYIIQHCLVHLGDLARYRQQPNVAAGYYLWAWVVHPDSGHPYNQLAILESSKGVRKCLDASLYYYVRAVACEYPFPAARTNMKGLLRAQLLTPSGPVSGGGEAAMWNADDVRHLLMRLYASLQLSADSATLVTSATLFTTMATHADRFLTEIDTIWLTRLMVIHLYFLTEHWKDTESVGDQGVADVGRTILLHLTVYWFELLTRQFDSARLSDASTEESNWLTPLVLLLLWLRLQSADDNRSASVDTAFRIYSPSLSEHVISFLNDLTSRQHSAAPSSTISSTQSPATLDWPGLLRLPELAQLQGFSPLQIPTYRQLWSALDRPDFACPFPLGSRLRQQMMVSTTNPSQQFESELFMQTASADITALRVRFILDSARIVARQLPALLSWSDNPDGGHFRHVSRPIVLLSELIRIPTPAPPVELDHVIHSHPDTNRVVNSGGTEPTETAPTPCVLELSPGIKPSDQSSATMANGELEEPSAPSDSLPKVQTIQTGLAIDPADTNERSASPTMAPPLSESSLTVPAPATSVPGSSSSGGLIVNAELAKFIQEQASQVAARQHRAELSSTDLRKLDDSSSETSNTRTGDAMGAKNNKQSYTARLCLSAAFRRDLPPRFARRLQAELMEREAAEQRLNTCVGSDSTKCNGSAEMMNFNQPAPLARKESEAPFELNSLLSATDPLTLVDVPDQTLSSARLVRTASPSPSLNSMVPPLGLLSNVNCVPSSSMVTQYQNSSLHVSSGPHFSTALPPYSTVIHTSSTPSSFCHTSPVSLLDHVSKPPPPPPPPDWHYNHPTCVYSTQPMSDYAASRFMLTPFAVPVPPGTQSMSGAGGGFPSTMFRPELSSSVSGPNLTGSLTSDPSAAASYLASFAGTEHLFGRPNYVQPPGAMDERQSSGSAGTTTHSGVMDGSFVYTSVP